MPVPSRHSSPDVHPTLDALLLDPEALGVVYQPIVHVATGEAVGYEVLTRVLLPPERVPFTGGPMALLDLAHAAGRLFECERRLRALAIAGLASHPDAHHAWFALNVDPRVVDDPSFVAGYTADLLAAHGVSPERIVLELTEAGAAQRAELLHAAVRHYAEQGYRVALDDVGAGFASLLAIVRIRPHIIKIDKEMIRDLERDPLRANLVHALAEFGRRSNVLVVAEGIETEEELASVVRAGVPYVQGFLLGRPAAAPSPVLPEIASLVRSRWERMDRARFRTARRVTVDGICVAHPALPSDVLAEELDALFRAEPSRTAYPVVDADGRALGLVTREAFLELTSGPFGYALNASRRLAELVDRQALHVEADTSLDVASRLATARDHSRVGHPLVVESEGRYVGLLPMQTLLKVVTDLEIQHATYASPLTGLPGNVVIESEIRRNLEARGYAAPAFVYVDIDNFKALNDAYGFAVGDDVLRLLAELLRDLFEPLGDDVLVGHVGGDDYVVVAPAEGIEGTVTRLCEEFDRHVRRFYAPADLARAGIEARDRRGALHFFPIASLSIAVVWESDLAQPEVREVARVAAELKRYAKLEGVRDPKSRWVRNRRTTERPP